MSRVGVVIVAGGSGSRVGGAELKQLRWVAGKPMLLHSLQAFQSIPEVAMVVCVLPKQYAGDPPPWIFQSDPERMLISVGGKTRAESVSNGLEDLPAECTTVLIHDAARPLVSVPMIRRVMDEAKKGHGAIAALPVVDTLKRVDADGRIVETVSREMLWRAQTPQGFPRDVIVQAHAEAKRAGWHAEATDDAALCERLGIAVHVVRGSERALKVTEAADFARAELMAGWNEGDDA
ncbi:2-C-methyl-D-erythritol 4-phosphate cytidylyltransferase [Pseudogemmatithrix spongiicola]|uniref:2-C-methyl-D-erythritol 4-phosphate cytidylyltransferase n=1 Tax=Pseudogemmatithrix spongiicola TaxID=3062599 RepID=A0AA49JZK3_9BACT|nr:2-C-methyl-D-erythritol 4-phosphate cytidylyltransferase [Gemmatimonadaceae bacterium 'strain 138']WKW15160.1 2-C-methyl-D-erythritol 4-phosphate cytidylyltransferase [Gemmatimonadaceae bacterium 'strain 318']